MPPSKKTEYMCKICGARMVRFDSNGRPSPGSCPRKPKTKSGMSQPHSWVISRKNVP